MTASPVEPLTKKEAGEVAESFCYHVEPYWRKLVAIGIGHHRVVPVMTEAQAAEAFEAWWERAEQFSRIDGPFKAWLACARHYGLIAETGEKT